MPRVTTFARSWSARHLLAERAKPARCAAKHPAARPVFCPSFTREEGGQNTGHDFWRVAPGSPSVSMVTLDWRPGHKALRKFGLVVFAGFVSTGVVCQLYLKQAGLAEGFYVVGAVLGLPAMTGTFAGLPGYWLWMTAAFVMGNIIGRILLGLVFYLVITPIGLVRRQSNDRLCLKKTAQDSYWHEMDVPNDPERYTRQF